MYKTITLLGLAICVQGFGQKEVVSAYNANKEGDFVTAAELHRASHTQPQGQCQEQDVALQGRDL